MGTWELTPAPLALGAVALLLYGRGWARLRRRRASLARRGNAALYVAGVLVAVLAVTSPLDPYGEQKLLTAHMAQHLLLGDVAPLLIVLGLRGPMAFFVLPPEALRALGHSAFIRRLLSFLLRPKVTLGLWVAVIYTWHFPPLYDAAIAHQPLHDLEHSMFLLVGLLVWAQIIDPAHRGRLGPGGRAAFAAGVFVAGLPLGELLIAAGPLYPHYAHLVNRPFGLSAAADQDHAGLLMMGEQIATLGTVSAFLLWSHIDGLPDLYAEPDDRLGAAAP